MKKILIGFALALLTAHSTAISSATSFPDIKSPVLLEAVEYLNEKGIIKGYPEGTFKPNQVINRAEALKIIFESRGMTVENDSQSGFPDVDSSQWFAKYVTSAKKQALISGYADGTYKPTQFVNKAEFMKIAMLAQSYFQETGTHQQVLSQFTDLDASAWYVPYLGFALENDFVDRVSKFNPTGGMTRGEAALIIYRVAKYNENLVEDESLPYLSCETCVNGVDLGQYEWSTLPFVKIDNGKLIIDGSDETSFISVKTGDKGVTSLIDRTKLKYLPTEEKMKVDQLYPVLYKRAIGIRGGIQDGDKYLQWRPLNKYLISVDDVRIHECGDECGFERSITSNYQGKGYPPFESWIATDDAKPYIYDTIDGWLEDHEEDAR